MSWKEQHFIVSLCVMFTIWTSFIGCDETDIFGEDKYAERLDWTLDSQGVSTIDARTENGEIALIGSEENRVTVDVTKEVRARNLDDAEDFAKEVRISVERRGDDIRIDVEHPKPPRGIDVSVHYDIRAPNRVNAELQTSNGQIQIRDIDGAVTAATSNGRIDLNGGTGQVDLHTSNGRIELRGTSGRVHASTSNGAIVAALQTLADEAIFSTSNSSIDVTIYNGIAPVTATTDNGSIDITLPASFSGKLDARTSNGSVRSEFSLTESDSSRRNRLVGFIGEGGKATVTLRSSNGNINLRKGHSDTIRRRR